MRDAGDRDAPPVVQLHGLTSSRERDALLGLDIGRHLGRTRGYEPARLLRYDARGHGESTGRHVPEDYRWHHLADDLLRLLDHVWPGERVHAVGPSMGSGTILHAALKEPDRFAGLTLLLPPTAWETRAAQAHVYEDQAVLVERDGLEAFVSMADAKPRPPASPPAPLTRPAITEALMPTVLRGAALADLPPREQVARVQAPTLLLAWVEDATHPLSTAVALHELMPGSRLEVATRPEHVARWPDLLAAQVAGGLERVRRETDRQSDRQSDRQAG